MIVEVVSAAIAFLSVLVAIWLGLKNQRLARENADLQKHLLKIEEAKERERKKTASKAHLRARIEERGQHNYRLVIENTGDCEARNVYLQMGGKPFEDHQAAVSGDGQVNHIGPHSHATKLLGLAMGCAPPFELEISWEDDSGEPGYYRTTLTF